MKQPNWRVRTGFGLLSVGLLIFFLVTDGAWYNQPLAENAGARLFGQSGLQLRVECSHDLIRFSPGEAFDFYAYVPTAPVQRLLSANSPLPRLRFKGRASHLQAMDSLLWLPTPIRPQDSLWTAIATFGNLHDFCCSRQFVEQRYLQRAGNYYAAYGAYPLGTFLYVWVPMEQKLFLLKKRG